MQVNHGGTEMGQGVHTQHRADRRARAGPHDRPRPGDGDAHGQSAEHLRDRGLLRHGPERRGGEECLRHFARAAAAVRGGNALGEKRRAGLDRPDRFQRQHGRERRRPGSAFPFAELLQRAYFARTSLSATGFYRTPEIHYDREAGRGKPFHYFAVGAAVSEVEVDGFTGMMHIRRVDILHDVGDAINLGHRARAGRRRLRAGRRLADDGRAGLGFGRPAADAFARHLQNSRDRRHARRFQRRVPDATPRSRTSIHGSKAVGEPPLMLAISVREAIRDAVAAFGKSGGQVPLASPATCEAIFNAISGRGAHRSQRKQRPSTPWRNRSCDEESRAQAERRARRRAGGNRFQERAARQCPERGNLPDERGGR